MKSQVVYVLGDSGTGKTSSLENLESETTFLISCIGKDLPYRGWKKQFVEFTVNEAGEKRRGNIASESSAFEICDLMKLISKNRPTVNKIVIDDFQYVMSYEFFDRANEKGYEKFTSIAKNAFNVISTAKSLREDIIVYLLCHTSPDINGVEKMKTVGKMLDEKFTPEGLTNVIMHSLITEDNKYVFQTNRTEGRMAKSPRGMFDTLYIPNDLAMVDKTIREYME